MNNFVNQVINMTLKHTVKLSLLLIMFFSLDSAFAQLHLDFGKQTAKVRAGTNPRTFYHFKGGQNAEILELCYFSSFNYKDPIIGLERSDMHVVNDTKLGDGFYLAKYSAHGKYKKHIYIQTPRESEVQSIATDSNYFYLFMVVTDSVKVGNSPTVFTAKKEFGLFKFNRDMSFVKSTFFDYDTTGAWSIAAGANKLVLSTFYNTQLDLNINGKNIKKEKPKTQYPNNNYDILLVSFDTALNYENHGFIESSRNTTIRDIHISKTNQISLALSTDQFSYLSYGKDTIQKDTSLSYGVNPAILWLDQDLKYKRHWSQRDVNILNIPYASFNDNGNIAYGAAMKSSSNIGYYMAVLRDSTGNLITQLKTTTFYTSTAQYQTMNLPQAMDGYFGITSKYLGWIFPDTTIYTNTLTRILLTADSLKRVEVAPFGNDNFKTISSQGVDYIMGELKFGALAELDTLNGNLPSYKIGTILDVQNAYYGLYKYTRECTPVKAKIVYDTMTVCANQYGITNTPRGSLLVEYEGTGAAFQWFMDPKFNSPLNDMLSPIQGGLDQRGTQTNYMTRYFGSTVYSLNKYLVKVNGACTEPYFLDTIYHQVWGTPILRPIKAVVSANVGDTAVLQTYLSDLGYPMDSLAFQWYKGNAALQEGSKYQNTTTQNLTINNVNAFDAIKYSCQVIKVNCYDGGGTRMEVSLYVENNIGIANIKKKSFVVSPNPAKNEARIETDIPYTGSVIFLNALGQKFTKPCVANKINTEQLASGIYFLSFENNGLVFSSKLIIE